MHFSDIHVAAVQFFNPSRDIKQQVSGKAIENPGGRTFTQVDASPTRTGMENCKIQLNNNAVWEEGRTGTYIHVSRTFLWKNTKPMDK